MNNCTDGFLNTHLLESSSVNKLQAVDFTKKIVLGGANSRNDIDNNCPDFSFLFASQSHKP